MGIGKVPISTAGTPFLELCSIFKGSDPQPKEGEDDSEGGVVCANQEIAKNSCSF